MKKLLVNFFAGFLFFFSAHAVEYEFNDSGDTKFSQEHNLLMEIIPKVVIDVEKISDTKGSKLINKFKSIIDQSHLITYLKVLKPKNVLHSILQLKEETPDEESFIRVIAFCCLTLVGEKVWGVDEAKSLLEGLYFPRQDNDFVEARKLTFKFIDQAIGNDLRSNFLQLMFSLELLPILPIGFDFTNQKEKAIKKTKFYIILKENGMKVQDELFSLLTEINQTAREHDVRDFVRYLALSFTNLMKAEVWHSKDAFAFLAKLYSWNSSSQKNSKESTPILLFINKVIASPYLKPTTRTFIEEITFKDQFDPVERVLIKYIEGSIFSEEAKMELVNIVKKLFADTWLSHWLMSKGVYSWIIVNRLPLFKGMGDFLKTTILGKYFFMHAFEETHLSMVKSPWHQTIYNTKALIKIITEDVKISDRHYPVSLAIDVGDKKRPRIKSIVLSEGDIEEVFFFVEELETESPTQEPTKISLDKRPLYKFEHIANSHKIRLKKASQNERDAIFIAINSLGIPLEDLECSVYTAIRHEKNLLLVKIMKPIGAMMAGAILETIDSYIEKYYKPMWGPLSKKDDFQNFRGKLRDILVLIYFHVTHEIIDTWPGENLTQPAFKEIHPTIGTERAMQELKYLMLENIDPQFFITSVMSFGYDEEIEDD